MGKESALYQLMDIRMNSVMNGITNSDGEYQSIIRKSDEYSGKLNQLDLPREVRLQGRVLGEMPVYRTATDVLKK